MYTHTLPPGYSLGLGQDFSIDKTDARTELLERQKSCLRASPLTSLHQYSCCDKANPENKFVHAISIFTQTYSDIQKISSLITLNLSQAPLNL